MIVGRNIRMVRKQRGLTLDKLSALCGISRDDLGQYERGQMTPRPGTVRKIAAALDVPIVAISEGMGWAAPEAAEQWETAEDGRLLYDGIVETLKEDGGEFALDEGEIQTLMESVKAAIPALVERMKDTRPEAEINRAILEELDLAPEDSEEELVRRYELTDEQWEQVRHLLPSEKAGKGRAFKSNRLMLNGILFWMRSGEPWSRLPKCYGRYKCVSDRLRLWQNLGVWEPVLQRLTELGAVDGTEER